jgi:hypothetical protein
MRENEDIPCGWMTLFTKHGIQVKLPVPDRPFDYADALANVESALAAGFVVTAPGLEQGESREDVGYVVHGESERDGEVTPYLLLYGCGDNHKFSFLKVYLNRPEDVRAFEFASKMRLDQIPVYIGDNKPERGKNSKVDKFIVPPPRPFRVVFKPNPKYDVAEAEAAKQKGDIYKTPARVFVRWADQQPADAPQAAPAPAPAAAPPEQPRQQAGPAPPSTPNPPGHETSAMKQAWTACHEAFQAAKLCGALTHPMWVERMKGYKASLIDDLNLHQRVETASWLNGLCKKHEPAAAPLEDARKALTGEAV